MPLRAADGSIRVTVVDGTQLTGLYAPDGSIYVVDASLEVGPVGLTHPCGARWYVSDTDEVGWYSANGAWNTRTDGNKSFGADIITVVV